MKEKLDHNTVSLKEVIWGIFDNEGLRYGFLLFILIAFFVVLSIVLGLGDIITKFWFFYLIIFFSTAFSFFPLLSFVKQNLKDNNNLKKKVIRFLGSLLFFLAFLLVADIKLSHPPEEKKSGWYPCRA